MFPQIQLSTEEKTIQNISVAEVNISPTENDLTNNENSSPQSLLPPPPVETSSTLPPQPPFVLDSEPNSIEVPINDDEKKNMISMEMQQISRTRVRRKAIRPNSTEANLLREFVMNHQMETLGINRSADADAEVNTESSSNDERDDNSHPTHDEKRQKV